MKPNRICLLLAASLFTLFSNGQVAAQSPASVTLVKAGRLLDPRTGNVLSPAAVLIENGKIKEVGSPSQLQAHAPSGVKTIDLGRSRPLHPGDLLWRWPSGSRDTLVRERVSAEKLGAVCLGHVVSQPTLARPSRITRKSHGPRVPDRTMVAI
jgi:hypothetical protein